MEEESLFGNIYRSNLDFQVVNLVERFISGEIKYPNFQRKLFWDVKASSRFVESILLGMPIPPILMAVDDKYTYEIVDGMNRMRAMTDFFQNKYKLSALDILSNLNGKSYEDLDSRTRRKFDNYTVNCIIVQINNKIALYEIFSRLNSGGLALREIDLLSLSENGDLIRNYIENILNRLNSKSDEAANKLHNFGKHHIEDIIYNYVILRDNYLHYYPPITRFVTTLRPDEFRNDTVDAFFASLHYIDLIFNDKSFRIPSYTEAEIYGVEVIDIDSQEIRFGKLSRRMAECQIIAFSKFIMYDSSREDKLRKDMLSLYASKNFRDALKSSKSRSAVVYKIESQIEILRSYGEIVEGFR